MERIKVNLREKESHQLFKQKNTKKQKSRTQERKNLQESMWNPLISLSSILLAHCES